MCIRDRKSRARYEIYKSIKTYDDYLKLIREKKIEGGSKSFGSGDLLNDLQKGYLKINKVAKVATVKTTSTSSQDVLKNIQEGYDPDPALLVRKMSESERNMFCSQHADAYCTELEQHHEDDAFSIERVNSNLQQAESRPNYMAAMLENLQMHLAAPDTDNDIDRNRSEFAHAMHREVVCGKTTPLSDKEARESEDWEKWRDSIKLEPVSYTHLTLPTICSV